MSERISGPKDELPRQESEETRERVKVPSVQVILLRDTEQGMEVFLGKRKAGGFIDQWSVPGGRIDGEETSVEAGLREVKEETGVELTEDELVFITHETSETEREKDGKKLLYEYDFDVFAVNVGDREPTNASPAEYSETGWRNVREVVEESGRRTVHNVTVPRDQLPDILTPRLSDTLSRIAKFERVDELGAISRQEKEDRIVGRTGAWGAENSEVLEDFRKGRSLALRAMARGIDRMLAPYKGKDKTVVEIGSGLGFLREAHTSDEWGRWIQMEPQEAFIDTARERSPNDTFIVGSAYELPLSDASADVVTGFASFDVFRKIDEAVAEVARVLKPGGAFVHFVDVGANDAGIQEFLISHEIPLQFQDADFRGEGSKIAIRIEEGKELPAEIKKLIVFKGGTVRKEVHFGPLRHEPGEERHFTTIRYVDINATFNKLLADSLERHGFKVLKAEREKAAMRGPRTEAQEKFPDVTTFYHGGGTTQFLPPLFGVNFTREVMEVSELDVVVAEKL